MIKVDATDPGAIGGVLALCLKSLKIAFILIGVKTTKPPSVNLVIHKAYNPEGITAYNVVPGLIGTILSMTMIMMTAMALTREKKRHYGKFAFHAVYTFRDHDWKDNTLYYCRADAIFGHFIGG